MFITNGNGERFIGKRLVNNGKGMGRRFVTKDRPALGNLDTCMALGGHGTIVVYGTWARQAGRLNAT